MKIGVAGPLGWASFRIRGEPLAKMLGWKLIDVSKRIREHFDVIWLVKRKGNNYIHVRNHCDRLVFDPLDFWHSPNGVNPSACWRRVYKDMPFDTIIATSPACWAKMHESMKGTDVPVHMLPHQCDHRVSEHWYDPAGPVVYAGAGSFAKNYEPILTKACRVIGREYRPNYSQYHGWQGLQGAALVLAIRCGRSHNCRFTRFCKPQIKIENAAAMRCPVLCGGHPAEISLHPECSIVRPEDFTSDKRLCGVITRALSAPPPSTCYRREHFFADAVRVVEMLGTTEWIYNYGETLDGKPVCVS